MPVSPQLLAAGAQCIGAIISGVSGLIQKGKANKMLKNMQYPIEQMPAEYEQNLRDAEGMAATGMPQEQYNQAMRNIQRQQLTALRYGNRAYLPQILQGTNDATLSLDSQDAQMRLANQKGLLGIRSQLGGVKRDLYDKNVRGKYNQDYNYAMQLKGVGNQNFVGGLDKLATSGLMFAGLGRGNGGTGYESAAALGGY